MPWQRLKQGKLLNIPLNSQKIREVSCLIVSSVEGGLQVESLEFDTFVVLNQMFMELMKAIKEWRKDITTAIDEALAYTLNISHHKSLPLFGDGKEALSFDHKFQLYIAADWFDFEDKTKLNMSKQLMDLAESKQAKNWNEVFEGEEELRLKLKQYYPSHSDIAAGNIEPVIFALFKDVHGLLHFLQLKEQEYFKTEHLSYKDRVIKLLNWKFDQCITDVVQITLSDDMSQEGLAMLLKGIKMDLLDKLMTIDPPKYQGYSLS